MLRNPVPLEPLEELRPRVPAALAARLPAVQAKVVPAGAAGAAGAEVVYYAEGYHSAAVEAAYPGAVPPRPAEVEAIMTPANFTSMLTRAAGTAGTAGTGVYAAAPIAEALPRAVRAEVGLDRAIGAAAGCPALTLPFCAVASGCHLLGGAAPGLELAASPHSPEKNEGAKTTM